MGAASRGTPAEPARDCALCPRLCAYRAENRRSEPLWFNGPAPSFGPEDARLLIVGLAPGRTGANRTGRPFTGDAAGDLLYAMLARHGFSRGVYGANSADGLTLVDAMITNAVRCAPPENRPTGAEITQCRPFLAARIAALPRLQVILALGKIAHDSVVRALDGRLSQYVFAHAARHLPQGATGPLLLNSYHCSRYNTNTGRLTEEMFDAVFATARQALGAPPPR
jgi:uracil-DNA glycosylase family 4